MKNFVTKKEIKHIYIIGGDKIQKTLQGGIKNVQENKVTNSFTGDGCNIINGYESD